MKLEEKKLPNGWEVKKISEVGKFIRGVNYKKNDASNFLKEDFLPVLRANNINGELNFEDLVFVPQKNIQKEQILKKGDIVFAMSSGSKHLVGKSAKVKIDFSGSFGAFCGAFRINENYNKDFIAYFFQSPFYRKVISEISKGTNINNLKREHILELDLPIPPLPEQQKIVAKIEELFSELENGKKELLIAQAKLKTYRQSLLKWAFEGRLTNENLKDGELPEGWGKIQIKDVADTLGGYAFKSGEFLNKGVYQVLRMGNVRSGLIRYEESPVFLNDIEDSVLKRSLLHQNDVIITQTGTRKKRDYGYTALIKKPNLLLNQRIASIRFRENYLPKFFLYFSWTDSFRDQFFANETGNVGQGNVGMKAVTETMIPCCSLEEQMRVISELESKLTICDAIEETIKTSINKCEALRQSILKKAFLGELLNKKNL